MEAVDAQAQGKPHIFSACRGHDQAQSTEAAKLQQPAGKQMAFGIMIVSQKNSAASRQGGDGGKTRGAAFFINYKNGPGQFPRAPPPPLSAAELRKAGGERGKGLAPSP
jgi:hypothetical protein